MKVCLLIAAFWIAVNVAVCAAIGWTNGWPDRSPPIDVPDPHGRLTRREREAIDMPDEAGARILVDDFAVRLLLESRLLSGVERPQVLVMGASSAAIAFRPEWLQPFVPDHQVSNLALYGTNLTAVRQTFDACSVQLPADVARRSVLVLGISDALFRSDASLWGKQGAPSSRGDGTVRWMTVVDRAMQRYPLVLDRAHPIGRILPPAVLDPLRERLRVWQRSTIGRQAFPAEWLAGQAAWKRQTPAAGRERVSRETARPPRPKTWREMSVVELADGLRRSTPPSGPALDQEQCEHFVALVREATGAGLRVVVIELPLHGLYREAVNLGPYRLRLAEMLEPFIRAGTASLVDLSAAVEDGHFSDLFHPAHDDLRDWNALLGATIAREVGAQSARSRD